eukprot:EG_transcript_20228
MPNVHHERGNAAYRAGRFQEALDHFTRAIQTDPRSAILFSNRAACRYFLEQFETALKDAEHAIKLSDNYAKGHFWRGAILVKQDRLVEARGSLTQAVRLDKVGAHAKAKALLEEVKATLKASGQAEAEAPLPKVGGKRRLEEEDEAPAQKKKKGPPSPPKGDDRHPVDPDSGHAHHGVVYKEKGYWDVSLSKADQNFRMQLIKVPGETPADDRFFLYFVGLWKFQAKKEQVAATQLTLEEAKHSFQRIFRERTGYAWADRGKPENRRQKPGMFGVDR